jgi:hypothetical protein
MAASKSAPRSNVGSICRWREPFRIKEGL